MSDAPLLSVVVPTYNRWPVVAETVRSALAQSAGPVEVLVVDDGSTDGTAGHLRAELPGVQVMEVPNGERGAARNAGAQAASGTWLTFLDSDDVLEPWHLETVLPLLVDGTDAVCTSAARWDPDTGATRPYVPVSGGATPTRHDALWGNPMLICCVVVRRSAFLRLGGFPEDRRVAGSEDWVFNLRLLHHGPVPRVDRVTARVREHEGRSMARPDTMSASRAAATELVLGPLATELGLDDADRRRVAAGAAHFTATQRYDSGDRAGARRALREVRAQLGPVEGWGATGRLWLLTLLPDGVRSAARWVRSAVARRR